MFINKVKRFKILLMNYINFFLFRENAKKT